MWQIWEARLAPRTSAPQETSRNVTSGPSRKTQAGITTTFATFSTERATVQSTTNGGTNEKQDLSLALVLFAAAGLAQRGTFTIDQAHSDVSFKVRHLVSKTTGQFTEFDGTIVADFDNLDASSVVFTIKAASIDTKNEDRDKHLRSEDFFDVETYPEIIFISLEDHEVRRPTPSPSPAP